MSLDVKVSSSNLGKNVIFRDDTLKLYSIERRLFVMTHFTLCAVSLFRFVDDVHFTSPERNPSIDPNPFSNHSQRSHGSRELLGARDSRTRMILTRNLVEGSSTGKKSCKMSSKFAKNSFYIA